MFNNVALDVFIGLIAIFLLYSLLASILMEMVAKYLGLRQRMTLKAHFKLLDDSQFTAGPVLTRLLIGIAQTPLINILKDRPLTALFYAHPNIKNLGSNNFNRKPSSITPEMFSDTLIQILRGDNFIGQQNQIDLIKKNIKLEDSDITKQGVFNKPDWYVKHSTYKPVTFTNPSTINIPSKTNNIAADNNVEELQINKLTLYQLRQFIYDSHSDIDSLKKRLITWHNEMMDRAEGWYIKQTRYILFLIGLILAISFNINAISISKSLATDKTARDKMIQFASSIQNDQKYKGTDIQKLSDTALQEALKKIKTNIMDAKSISGPPLENENGWTIFFGYLITGLAISLGAPFWFDLLGKIMCIRQGGNNSSTDAQKKVDTSLINPTEQPIG